MARIVRFVVPSLLHDSQRERDALRERVFLGEDD